MKAAVINKFGPPEVFEIAEMPEPDITDDELLIEVLAGSVNPIDCKQRKGNHKFIFGSRFPIILGYDVSGTVVRTGKKVKKFKIGEKVCGVLNNKYGGGLGQYAKSPEKCFSRLPENADVKRYAALPLAGLTVLQALRDKAKIREGHKILIIGAAGGVGNYAVQIANIFKAEVYAVSSARHENFLGQLRPLHFIDYTKTDITQVKERFDSIFDTAGTSFLVYRHLLRPGGIYVTTLPRPQILVHKIMCMFTTGKKARTLLMRHDAADLEQLVTWVEEGKLSIYTDKEFSLKEISKAHVYSEEGHAEGKILIRYH